MPKIDIEVTITNSNTNDNYQVTAIISDDKIKYNEPDNTKVVFDYQKKELIRENDTMKMTYSFNNKSKSNILIKEYDRYIDIDIKTNKVIHEDNNLEIEYEFDNDKFLYRIEEIK